MHTHSKLLQLSCELVATAVQNNPVCQQAFIPALPRLLEVVDNTSMSDGARVKALYAISCESSLPLSVCSMSVLYVETMVSYLLNVEKKNSVLTVALKGHP